MSNLLRQFIKKKILTNQKIKEFSATKSPSDFNDLKTPGIHSFHPSEKSSAVRSPLTKSRNAVYYEDRDKKMERTEHDLLDFKKKMIEFYFSLKNWILLDQDMKERLNDLLFAEEIGMELKNFSLDNSFQMISKIIKLVLNLQQKIKSVSLTDLVTAKENDSFLVIQTLEAEIAKLRKEVIYLENLNQFSNEKCLIYENNSKMTAKQCEETIAAYKKDYIKLLNIVKEKEQDIDFLRKEVIHQEEIAASYHDKLLSVVVLEHKIKELEKKFQNDLSKNNDSNERKIKEIENTRQFNPNFFKKIKEFEDSRRLLQKSVEQKNRETEKILEKKRMEIQDKNNLFVKLSNSLNSVTNEREKLKETISSKNKEIFNLESKANM